MRKSGQVNECLIVISNLSVERIFLLLTYIWIDDGDKKWGWWAAWDEERKCSESSRWLAKNQQGCNVSAERVCYARLCRRVLVMADFDFKHLTGIELITRLKSSRHSQRSSILLNIVVMFWTRPQKPPPPTVPASVKIFFVRLYRTATHQTHRHSKPIKRIFVFRRAVWTASTACESETGSSAAKGLPHPPAAQWHEQKRSVNNPK